MCRSCWRLIWRWLKRALPTMLVLRSGGINHTNCKAISGHWVHFHLIKGCIIYEMCALKPPFTANSLEALYKKVLFLLIQVSKGVYPRIPANYSNTLEKFIARCIQLDPKKRPTCKELLKLIPNDLMSTISDDPDKSGSEPSTINLLSTIKVPRNLQSWRDDLPKQHYEEDIKKNESEKASFSTKFGNVSQEKLR